MPEPASSKNLFKGPDEAEKKDTKRAWALDFRLASVREHSGGAGVVLLSATPAKNNPVEFYTMLHYIRPDCWTQVGIDNPMSWAQRFCLFEEKLVPTASGGMALRSVVTKFQNLDEMRDVFGRWAEFKVAEEVGLKLPEAIRKNHSVHVTTEQGRALAQLWHEMADLEEKIAKASHIKGDDGAKVLRILQDKRRTLAGKIYLSYIHADLPGIGADMTAIKRVNPHDAPKLVAAVREIMATAERVCRKPKPGDEPFCLGCGHIVFVDNVAPHYWMKALLVEAGIPVSRIAILNAKEAGDLELRQQIVEAFNGVGDPEDDEFTPPAYDVVIANAVAYEGVDLQRRTCAIHHLDVPWEPATLQQRNGRGVRRGNQFDRVTLHYYFVEGSNEIHRIDRIERKRGWMSSLVSSQARATNTTREEDSGEDLEELALSHARPEDREKILKARREQAAAAKEAKAMSARHAANAELRGVALQFRRAERERDPARAGDLRDAALIALAQVRKYASDLWPGVDWHARALSVREGDVFIPEVGPPLRPGDTIGVGRQLFEIGPVSEVVPERGKDRTPRRGVYLRAHRSWRFSTSWTEDIDLSASEAELDFNPGAWTDDLDEVVRQAAGDYRVSRISTNADFYAQIQLYRYSPAVQTAVWERVLAPIFGRIRLQPYMAEVWVPVETAENALGVLSVETGVLTLPAGAELLPPTPEGWARFLGLADRSELPWALCEATARWWWHRGYPKGRRQAVEGEE